MKYFLALAVLVATSVNAADPTVLVYETQQNSENPYWKHTQFLTKTATEKGLKVKVFGNGDYKGWGSKYEAAKPILEKMPSDDLAIISDGRDVLFNNIDSKTIKSRFDALTKGKKNAVVVSGEAQCCVSSMSHKAPGSLFDKDLKRTDKACASGKPGCTSRKIGSNIPKWTSYMQKLAKRNLAENSDDIYVNAGLIAGKAKDLLDLITKMAISEEEDDQHVLTDLLYAHEEKFVIDYFGKLFGNTRWVLGDKKGCVFEPTEKGLTHVVYGEAPAFIHTSNNFLSCLNELSSQLGYELDETDSEMVESANTRRRLNYDTTVAPCPAGKTLVGSFCVSVNTGVVSSSTINTVSVATVAVTGLAAIMMM